MKHSNDRRSRSIQEFSTAHGWSVWFSYKLAREGKLTIRKAGRRSIITAEDEAACIDALPAFEPRVGPDSAAA
jgi:hypothetical protein